MKKCVCLVFSLFLLVNQVLASESVLLRRTAELKKQAVLLDSKIAELRKEEYKEYFEEDNFLTDFFTFVENGEKNYPEALTAEEKKLMQSIFDQMSQSFTKAEQSTRTEVLENAYGSICELADFITDKILFIPSERDAIRKTAVVTVEIANLRSGPGTSFNEVGAVKKGDRLNVIDETMESGVSKIWYKVESAGKTGWISQNCVSIENSGSDTVLGNVTVTVDGANVRKKPSLSAPSITGLPVGTVLPYYEIQYAEERNWYRVKIKSGEMGWMSEKTLDVGGNTPEPQVSGQAEKNISVALRAVGQSGTLYGFQVYNEDTQWGVVACAAVVSAILIEADVNLVYELYCPTLKSKLKNLGWESYSTSNWKAGDVIFWRKATSGSYEQTREKHVGVIVGNSKYREWLTVDNSSTRKEVVKRALNRPSTYPVNGPACTPD